MTQEYLSPSPPPPAISAAMAKASERLEKGLPVYNFASGNVGALPLNLSLFDAIDFKINDGLPESIHIIAEAMKKGLINSLYPRSTGLTYSTTGGTTPAKIAALRYFREIHGLPLHDDDTNRVLVSAGGQQSLAASLRSLKPGTEVLMFQWEYAPVSSILKDHGLREIRMIMGDDLSLDVADFEKKLGEKRTIPFSSHLAICSGSIHILKL